MAVDVLAGAGAAASEHDARESGHLAAVKSCFEHVLRVPGLGPDDDFFELGGDSASAVELALEIETATGISLPMTAAFDAPTPGAMARLVASYQGREPGDAILLKVGLGTEALFLFPGAGGTAVGVRPFALGLNTDLAIYGFDAPGLNGRQAPLDRVEALAAHHLMFLRKVQPRGPYYLAGYSVGGLIAYEIARLLRAQGEAVAVVGLIDTVIARPNYGIRALGKIWLRRAGQHLRVARHLKVLQAARYAALHGRSVFFDIVPDRKKPVVRAGSASDAGAEANRRYVPGRYDGRVVLLWSDAGAEHNSLDLVWQSRARRLIVYRLPGDHRSAMAADVAAAAGAFSAALADAQGSMFCSEKQNQKTFVPSAHG